ncbi:terminase large subunit domain-containing protein [Nonomuraea angiospora]|uniref:terminase large subunit domain-containing protein n=1 Tax=Nonomuraea angiospora TaxID=46172 RepID=UPI0029B9B3A5|nr:terminase family protein [Nonomuraea angiospora]MDX3101740.1 terminase large subunit [Nonomuraea angiospora]
MTLGPAVGVIAARLGTPLMPWQQYVADVILEIDPATGRLAYREYNITVPRQSGKTTLLLAKMVHRALGFKDDGRQRILYAAQTRGAARLKWEDEHVATLEASRYRKLFTVRKQLGQEAIRWKNGSRHGITSNTEKAAHGETLDEGVIDEAFAQEDNRVEQAFKPAMITRPQPQQGVVSTAGTLKSVYLREKVDAGRERCEAGAMDTVAYFEWSAPEDADPGDPATWALCMPALGHTIGVEAIRADFESMKLAEYRRAYLNQWPDTTPDQWLVISEEQWRPLADEQSELVSRVAFAVHVAMDRSWAAIAVAGRRADGLLHVEIVDYRLGTKWVPERAKQLQDRWNPCAWVVDAGSPAGSLIADLEAQGLVITKPTVKDVAHAYGQFIDAVAPKEGEPVLRYIPHAALDVALAGAATRSLATAKAWDAIAATTESSPLIAVTNAAWGFATKGHIEEPPPVMPFAVYA